MKGREHKNVGRQGLALVGTVALVGSGLWVFLDSDPLQGALSEQPRRASVKQEERLAAAAHLSRPEGTPESPSQPAQPGLDSANHQHGPSGPSPLASADLRAASSASSSRGAPAAAAVRGVTSLMLQDAETLREVARHSPDPVEAQAAVWAMGATIWRWGRMGAFMPYTATLWICPMGYRTALRLSANGGAAAKCARAS